ncbi:N-acetyldiaminopimelate deacetylase [Natribacillus halophilus]|uniref:N-acetyldiaminopimelate deacetylase n=1 Tax=Natribacillus halophilus TaxID=549003 RepID=A0A1G8MAL7_9BACI|nr:N-acetyldiaminopimelate deacetylase [Natribacillus halophilus]SDI64887.1 N-acetyldiaminopimelate deacetylase [Natribacillus halophilus]
MYTREEMSDIRRFLHAQPELGFEEYKTQRFLLAKISEMPADHLKVETWRTGILVFVAGDAATQTIGYRTDMDGLPIKEETGLSFASQYDGKMHACGHDLHMTIALGILSYYAENQPKDNLLFVFQPAEEGPGGAEPMLEADLFQQWRPDWMFALHIAPNEPVGTVTTRQGLLFANTAEFMVHLGGRGGHAAYPHLANDMVVAASHFVTQIQSVVARRIDPLDSAVITIGKIESGTKENIIAERADTEGTIRTLSAEAMNLVQEHVRKIGAGIAESFDCTVEVEWGSQYKQVWNSDKVSSFMSFSEASHDVTFKQADMAMTGEDFGFFLEKIPGFMFWLGVDSPAYGLHDPGLNPDEGAIPVAVHHIINYLNDEMGG